MLQITKRIQYTVAGVRISAIFKLVVRVHPKDIESLKMYLNILETFTKTTTALQVPPLQNHMFGSNK